ncbi:MAG: metallophosphoesterase family protein, partial [Planctomycetota bacterium]
MTHSSAAGAGAIGACPVAKGWPGELPEVTHFRRPVSPVECRSWELVRGRRMLIGICSDSHNRHESMRRAVEVFDRAGVERIVHCGDVGGEAVFDELVGREVRFVWGNTDVPGDGLRAYLATVGIPPPRSVPLLLEWAGRRIAVFHGHEPGFAAASRVLDVDYIFCGHTHARNDERLGH